MKKHLDISIVTINYNSSHHIKKLLDSINADSSIKNFEFIALDNASPNQDDVKLKSILEPYPWAHFIGIKKNLGFGKGYDETLKFTQGEFLVIINPDIQIQKGSILKLINTLKEEKDIGIIGPQLYDPNGKHQHNARDFPSIFKMIKRRLLGESLSAYLNKINTKEKLIPTHWLQGSFMVTKMDFFKNTLKGFDPRFFLFLEDTDLCRRCWEKGKRVILMPSVKAFHGEKRLSGNNFHQAIFKKTFWIHIHSSLKYFSKYLFKPIPPIF